MWLTQIELGLPGFQAHFLIYHGQLVSMVSTLDQNTEKASTSPA